MSGDNDEMICVVPGDGSKALGVCCVLMPEPDDLGARRVFIAEDMVLAWARNIQEARRG